MSTNSAFRATDGFLFLIAKMHSWVVSPHTLTSFSLQLEKLAKEPRRDKISQGATIYFYCAAEDASIPRHC
jgi:hypothetical protein